MIDQTKLIKLEFKICTQCHTNKELSEFYFRKDSNRYRNKCKRCCNLHNQNYYNKFPWKKVYRNIYDRCNNPKVDNYKYYGFKGIKCLITEEEIEFLWYRDKAYLMDKPSIDRKNSNKNYTLENCRFIEQGMNSAERNQRISSKQVLQFDLQGNFITEFESVRQATNYLNKTCYSSIANCARGLVKSTYGYKWKYKNAK